MKQLLPKKTWACILLLYKYIQFTTQTHTQTHYHHQKYDYEYIITTFVNHTSSLSYIYFLLSHTTLLHTWFHFQKKLKMDPFHHFFESFPRYTYTYVHIEYKIYILYIYIYCVTSTIHTSSSSLDNVCQSICYHDVGDNSNIWHDKYVSVFLHDDESSVREAERTRVFEW